MKKIFNLTNIWATAGFALIFLFASCMEKPIEIPDLSVGKRRVLVEEATGVRCAACPDGAKTLTSLQGTLAAEGRELIVVSMHAAGPFSVPYTGNPANLYDFRSPDAQALSTYIGALEGFPSSAINRRLLPNETSTFVNPHTRWEGVIRSELAKDYGFDIFIANDFNPATRQLNINVDILPDQTIMGENRLTVLITQDSIKDLQNEHDVFKPNYLHRHVLRDMVTNGEGDVITEVLATGTVVHKSFSVILPANWNEKHCSVVAFVHHGGNPDKEVLQAAEQHVVD